MRKVWFDSETFSTVPIKNGAWAYAEQARVLIVTWAVDDDPVEIWAPAEGEPMPDAFAALMADDQTEWWGQNSTMFDWPVFSHALPELFAAVPLTRRRDTMAQAYAHSLPGSLDKLCEILGVSSGDAKDKRGKALIQLFCVPDKATGKPRATPRSHPTEWQEFREYAKSDITAMRAVHAKMPKWNYPNNVVELEIHALDSRINYRGIAIDTPLMDAAIDLTVDEKAALKARTQELTYDEVTDTVALESTTKRDAFLKHMLAQYGVDLPDLKASTIERRIDDPNIDEGLRELLRIRLQASSTSVTKYKSLKKSISSDGRLRGTLQYCGAARTGRWAGRLFQPQNLARVPKYVAAEWEQAIESIKTNTTQLVYHNPTEVVGSCVRGVIVAPPGRKLVVADLSNIEGRMLAWLANERWKIKAFADFDNGIGTDLYKLTYARTFGVSVEDIDDFMRQIGKVEELAFGYEGGVGAWITFGAAYNIDLDDMARRSLPTLPGHLLEEAESYYKFCKKSRRTTFGLKAETFIACDAIKRGWREGHQAVVEFWRALGEAVVYCTIHAGETMTVGKLKIRRDGNWLRIRLPSGRFLCYPSPKVEDGKWTYMGVNQYTRQWGRISSYGGKIAENVTQAASRDQMAWGMLKAEGHGFDIIASIHDEAPSEVDDDSPLGVDDLSACLAGPFGWNAGLPLAAAGFESYRYRK